MNVLVCGGRDYADVRALNEALDAIHREKNITRLIHGAARGADSLAAAWARSRCIPILAFPADWKKDGKAAGFVRNARMLRDGRPELLDLADTWIMHQQQADAKARKEQAKQPTAA